MALLRQDAPIPSPPRRLNGSDWDVLAQAVRDVNEIGRMRTSTEIHGNQHRKRGHMLAALRRLEDDGYVMRLAHNWTTGTVTLSGRAYIANNPRPARRVPTYGSVAGGLHEDGGTKFKNDLIELGQAPILALGAQNPKLGRVVSKGPHKGKPMRYVTLEEGKTCPSDCGLKSKCYGGNMPLAKRITWRGEKTGEGIAEAIRTSKPSMIRLHNLGDFPSISYARNVLAALKESGSAAFGFTHWQPTTTLGYALRRWAADNWGTFAIRTSYLHGSREPIPDASAVIVEHPDQAKQHNAVVCPEQMGQTPSCAECGYCWHSRRPVAFVLHENLARLKTQPPVEIPAPFKKAA